MKLNIIEPQQKIEIPIWPLHDAQSPLAKRMREAKQKNDETFWPVMIEAMAASYADLPLDWFKCWAVYMIVPMMSTSKHWQYIQRCTHRMAESEVCYEALEEPMIGINEQAFKQLYSVFDNVNVSMNRMHHAAHLFNFGVERAFDNRNMGSSRIESIVELGAGSGDMADICHKLGFKGTYQVFDFPEMMAVQKWYHDQLKIPNVEYCSEIEQLKSADLVIATWSLTEMPIELRNSIVEQLKDSQSWLIAYSKQLLGFDNEQWINDHFLKVIPPHRMRLQPIEFMPWDGGTNYLYIDKEN